ncbi:MAG: tetratricopeptide repeat protein, partial [Rhodospirillaceae bacterium]
MASPSSRSASSGSPAPNPSAPPTADPDRSAAALDAVLARARQLLSEGRPEDAMDALEAAPGGVGKSGTGGKTAAAPAVRNLMARIALAQGRSESAAGLLEDMRKSGTMALEAAVTLGSVHLANGDLTLARTAFAAAQRMAGLRDPGAMVALAGLAEVAEREGRPEDAIAHLREGLAGALAMQAMDGATGSETGPSSAASLASSS